MKAKDGQYLVPRLATQITSEWCDELAVHLCHPAIDVLDQFVAVMKFPRDKIRMELMDVSLAEFKSAFFIAGDAKKEIAVTPAQRSQDQTLLRSIQVHE